jgi:methylase of polypeptide subunit release factors
MKVRRWLNCDVHTIALEEIGTPQNQEKLQWLFNYPDKFKPKTTSDEITAQVAKKIGDIALVLSKDKGHEPHKVAHFLNQCVFCCYAEDVGLLPDNLFTRLLESALKKEDGLPKRLHTLFTAMQTGGDFGEHSIDWFNGGLFAEIDIIPLPLSEIKSLLEAARLDWSNINPSIFGTLFERGLDPKKRSQLGAHYTDAESIFRILRPVIEIPLLNEWASLKPLIAENIAKWEKAAKNNKAGQNALLKAKETYQHFLEKIRLFKVLDPACGSGNFLYLALKMLKDIQHQVMLEAEVLGLSYDMASLVNPECVMGIEINPYAAELARLTVWIGEIQWMLAHGLQPSREPILKSLQLIDNRDALLNADGSEATWPQCDVIVGNPPFLGGKKMVGELSEAYTQNLRAIYGKNVHGLADLVIYWFEKAYKMLLNKQVSRVGFVATNSIRDNFAREIMSKICTQTPIYHAWSDEAWVNDGADVRVSLVCFSHQDQNTTIQLDSIPVKQIHADLSAETNITQAKSLDENQLSAFQGTTRSGSFDITGELARTWLLLPANPNGKKNQEVVKPWSNGLDLTRRHSDTWIIDFGVSMTEEDAALYEAPFEYTKIHVKPTRQANRNPRLVNQWWHYDGVRVGLRKAVSPLNRYIATVVTAKYRLFMWLDKTVLPDATLIVIAKEDDTTFGILHSRFHELWSLATGTSLEDRPRYTPSTCFETFPFPTGLSPANTKVALSTQHSALSTQHSALSTQHSALSTHNKLILPSVNIEVMPHALAIAQAAFTLNQLRENWLNPVEWTERIPEVVAGYPDRIVAKKGHETELKKRTLTNLYNTMPQWLKTAHANLDKAVAAAYGWTDYTAEMSDQEILARLLALNLAR